MIVLVGFMGAGKTTVGRILARKTGLPFVDTDMAIERSTGETIAGIFQTGEARFRTLEKEAVARALQGPESIVALGGGALNDPATCALLEWHTVVHLDVPYGESMRRIGVDPGRPMLHRSDPRALFGERRSAYARLATHIIDTAGATPEGVAEQILETTGIAATGGPARVQVELGDRSYPVLVGRDLLTDVGRVVPTRPASRAFVITHPALERPAKPLLDSLEIAGLQTAVLPVEEGEASKTLSVAEGLVETLAARGAHRSDLIVTFGGGVVCDLGGLVASIYHRGMPVLHVPTTLLAQVDAAIGGKTAVNLTHGKNLVGTIHQPIAVVCDVSLLRSLPDEEMRSGLAEVIKYGLIADPGLLGDVQMQAEAIFARDEDILAEVVGRSAAIKAAVVSGDEREEGRREILNYGHTFGHGIEHATGMRHGEAIALGMMAAAHLATGLGMLPEEGLDAHSGPLGAVGLPVSGTFDVGAALEAMQRDKKARASVRFVLLDAIGSVRTGVEARADQVETALRRVAR